MKYRCIPCEHVFEVKEGTKPRCPRCMKIHDLEPVSGEAGEKPENKKKVAGAVLVLVAICAAAVYFLVVDETGETGVEKPEVGKLSVVFEELGVPPAERVEPFKPTKKITSFAEDVVGNKDDSEAIQALFEAIGKLKNDGKWKPYSQREPRLSKPRHAADLLYALNSEEDGPLEVLSYELAAFLLAAARSVEAEANMAEIYRFADENKPADEHGKLGRYGVVSGDGGKGSRLFDPYSGRVVDADKVELFVLSAAEATAPYYGISALALLAGRDMAEALTLNKIAVGLAPDNPYFRSGRGMIFISSGAPNEALVEFEKAIKKRGDAVTRLNLAEILLMVDPTGMRSEAEVQIVLNTMADYARAHAILAIVHLMNREPDKAEQELALAERLEPSSPVVAMYWSQYYLSQAKYEDAISKAQDAVRFSDESATSLIGLAQVYKVSARFDQMRATLDRVYKMLDAPAIARELKEVFQYDPDEAAAEGEDGEEIGTQPDDQGLQGGRGLKLGEGLGGSLGEGQGGGLGSGKRLNLDLNLK